MNNVRHHFGHHASPTEGSSLQVENLSVCIILYQQGFKDFKNDKDADKDKYKVLKDPMYVIFLKMMGVLGEDVRMVDMNN